MSTVTLEELAKYPTYWEGHAGGSKTGRGNAAFQWRVVGYLVITGALDPITDATAKFESAVRQLAKTIPGAPAIEANIQEVGIARSY